jgi:opacity protein-like surface antigen
MRSSLAAAALAAFGVLASAPAASADNYGVAYLGLRGSFTATDTGSTQGAGDYDYNEDYADGFGAALFMGWVLDDNFRLEIEGGFRSADLDTVTIIRDTGGPYSAGDVVDVGGDAQAGTAMVNLYYDIHLFNGRLLPWVGVGLGGAFVDYQIDEPLGLFNAEDASWTVAYQFMAGVTFPISESMSMSVGYRYFQTQDFTYINIAGDEQETDLMQHSVDVAWQIHL